MTGIEVIEVDEEEFLALEKCLEAAERQGAGKGQQSKRLFEVATAELVPAAKMHCTAGQQGMPLAPQLPQHTQQPQPQLQQQQQQHLELSLGYMQRHRHQALMLQHNSNLHNSCTSSEHVSQLPQQYPHRGNMEQHQHGYSEKEHQQQHVPQHSAHNQQQESQQSQGSLCQAAFFSMPAPPAGQWSGGSITSSSQRQQSAPEYDSRLVQRQRQQQQQQQQLPVGQPHQQSYQQQGHRLLQPLQRQQQQPLRHQQTVQQQQPVPQQEHGGQEWQRGHHQKCSLDLPTARPPALGVAAAAAAAAGSSGSGLAAQRCQAGVKTFPMCTTGSSICGSVSTQGAGTVGKCIDQHNNVSQVQHSSASAAAAAAAAAQECCGASGGQFKQAAPMGGGGCVAGVVYPQPTAVCVRCAGLDCARAVSILPPGAAGAGACYTGSAGNLRNVHGCSSRTTAHTQGSVGAAECEALGVARNVCSSSDGGAAALSSRQADRCNSSGTGASTRSGSGGSSRRLPASLANSTRGAATATGQQGTVARTQQLQQQQQQQQRHQAQQGKVQQQQQQQQQQAGLQKPLQLEYHGQVRYACQPHEVDWLCQQLLDAGPPGVVGFDLEWRPTYRKGCAPNKTALLQLAYAVDKHGKDWRPKPDGKGVMVLLLHVLYSGITPHLQTILSREDIVKVGVNISGDANKLLADFNVEVDSISELSDVANGRQLSCVDGITCNIEPQKRWSLAGLVQEVMCVELPKPNDIRCGNWEKMPLEKNQQRYAAMDAFACLLLHWELQDLPERLTLSQQLRLGMMERAAAAVADNNDDE